MYRAGTNDLGSAFVLVSLLIVLLPIKLSFILSGVFSLNMFSYKWQKKYLFPQRNYITCWNCDKISCSYMDKSFMREVILYFPWLILERSSIWSFKRRSCNIGACTVCNVITFLYVNVGFWIKICCTYALHRVNKSISMSSFFHCKLKIVI